MTTSGRTGTNTTPPDEVWSQAQSNPPRWSVVSSPV